MPIYVFISPSSPFVVPTAVFRPSPVSPDIYMKFGRPLNCARILHPEFLKQLSMFQPDLGRGRLAVTAPAAQKAAPLLVVL